MKRVTLKFQNQNIQCWGQEGYVDIAPDAT